MSETSEETLDWGLVVIVKHLQYLQPFMLFLCRLQHFGQPF